MSVTEQDNESNDVLDDFSESDLNEIENGMKKNMNHNYNINCESIAKCIEHEMYGKLANAIRFIINNNNIKIGYI